MSETTAKARERLKTLDPRGGLLISLRHEAWVEYEAAKGLLAIAAACGLLSFRHTDLHAAMDAFLLGSLVLAYPLLRTSRLTREGDAVMMQRSNAFLAVILLLAAVRIAARGYLDTVLSVQQTAGLFFILAFGMILRWRTKMLFDYRSLSATHGSGNG